MSDTYIVNIETGMHVDCQHIECEEDADDAIHDTCINIAEWTGMREPRVLTFKHFEEGNLRSVKQVMVKPYTQYSVIPVPRGE